MITDYNVHYRLYEALIFELARPSLSNYCLYERSTTKAPFYKNDCVTIFCRNCIVKNVNISSKEKVSINLREVTVFPVK